MKSPKNKMLSVHNNLQDLGILLIGGTGFLGKVWLSLVLKRFPNVGHIYLIVRSRRRADGSIRQSHDVRFWSEVATSPALNPLREGRSAKEYNDFINEKISIPIFDLNTLVFNDTPKATGEVGEVTVSVS